MQKALIEMVNKFLGASLRGIFTLLVLTSKLGEKGNRCCRDERGHS